MLNISKQEGAVTSEPEVVTRETAKAFPKWLKISLIIVTTGLLLLFFLPAEYQENLLYWFDTTIRPGLSEQLLFFVLVGFMAQIIDGALGMAYGVSSTSFLLGLGVPPALASSSVHVAEVITAGISGLSHLKMGNVNRKLFQSLALPGAIGAIVGAYVLTSLDGKLIKPIIAVYLLVMGVIIIRKAFRRQPVEAAEKKLAPLALFGGFVDAVGGGGWGPVVASTLLSRGHNPRYTIGSVNLAEFFVALAGAGMFVALIGTGNWQIILGLILGGAFAAPFAAYLCKKFSVKTLMIMVGLLIIALSIRNLVMTNYTAWLDSVVAIF